MNRIATAALIGLLLAIASWPVPAHSQTYNYLPKVLRSNGIPGLTGPGGRRGYSPQSVFTRPRSYGHLRIPAYPRAPRLSRRSSPAFDSGFVLP